MIIATVVIAIFAVLAFLISLGNFIYLYCWNHCKSVDFFAEIKSIKKDDKRIHGEDEKVNLYLVNQGCPITILGIYFDEGRDNFKMHIDLLPARLERGEILKIPEKDFPTPVNRSKIDNKNVHFYAVDSFENEYVMKRIFRKAHPTQPKVSKSDNM